MRFNVKGILRNPFYFMAKKRYRPESDGAFQSAYEKNRRTILAQGDVCALCGMPIDRTLKFPHPMSASVDHIIPIAKGGHPSSLDNLQAVHLICNQVKGSRLVTENNKDIQKESALVSNRIFPHAVDWLHYRAK